MIGQTRAGRHICVIYVPDPEPDSVFVITAYELAGKPLMAYRCPEGERYDAEQIPSRLGRNTSPLSLCAL